MENKYQYSLDNLKTYLPKYYGSAKSQQYTKMLNESSVTLIQELIDNYQNTEKALDKACEILEPKMKSLTGKTKDDWKELLLKDGLL